MQILSHGCTLDCFDCCKFQVYVEDGRVIKIEGDPSHPYTQGFICIKGKKHLERLYHPKRVLTPLKKVGKSWVEIDFPEALEIISKRLSTYRDMDSSNAVLHYSEAGSGGVLKGIEDVFFNCFGGITLSKGSTCWGAGIAAQTYDFGEVKGHLWEDILQAKSLILWGRNPANTSLHLMNIVKKAKQQGTKVIVIDPIRTATAEIADLYVRINPSTDGALAMAMTKVIIEEDLLDREFIHNHVQGFAEYAAYLNTLKPNYLSEETGISWEEISKLAELYSGQKPSTIYPGYGLQKYKNGGNTIRAIDALAAISGQVGRRGGGVNYANRVYPGVLNLDPYNSSCFAKNQRYFQVAEFAEFIQKENSPPIKAIFISKANPLTQWPNLNHAMAAFDTIEFKVCLDLFMTDTAARCDLFIPCTNTLETEDLLYSSMGNPYLIYNEKAIEPANPLMDEYAFFQELATKMQLDNYPFVSKQEYLAKIIEPLKEKGITLETIKREPTTIQSGPTAWSSLDFSTPSGKIELYSEQAKADGLSPIPTYESSNHQQGLRLIVSHSRDSIFSQHFLDVTGCAEAAINPLTAEKYQLCEGDQLIMHSTQGEIEVKVKINEKIPDQVVHMYTGWWQHHGNPNFLTANFSADLGGQIAYHETFVEFKTKKLKVLLDNTCCYFSYHHPAGPPGSS